MVHKTTSFFGGKLVAPRPNHKLEDHPLSLSVTAYWIYLQLPSILGAVPPSATWGQAMQCWQGPPCHGSERAVPPSATRAQAMLWWQGPPCHRSETFLRGLILVRLLLTVILLTWRIWWAPNNASRWHMGFNLAIKSYMKVVTQTGHGRHV
jgi:hypothetical protein